MWSSKTASSDAISIFEMKPIPFPGYQPLLTLHTYENVHGINYIVKSYLKWHKIKLAAYT